MAFIINSMEYSSRRKQKVLTVPVKATKISIIRKNSESLLRDHCDLPLLDSIDQSPSKEGAKPEKKFMKHKIHILDQMGFTSQIETTPNPISNMNKQLKRRFSIGISHFWTGENRQKFLKENGYEEAFKTLKKKVIVENIQGSNSLRKPTLPHIMDSNMKRRSLGSICLDSSKNGKTKLISFNTLTSRNSEKIGDALDVVVEKCNNLAKDNLEFKKYSKMIELDLKYKYKERTKLKN